MPAERAKALFSQFFAIAVAEHKFSSASLGIHGSSEQTVQRYERVVGTSSRDRYFTLNHEQSDRCIDELIKDEAAAAGTVGHFILTQAFEISKWLIDGHEAATKSIVSIHYGQLPCIMTFFQFETVEQFQSVKRVLEDIGLCKLNEKHLKPIRMKKARAFRP
ncbi:MAG TPA: hypothetical protein VG938_00560 [Verrucomicrobiae bacterium]|jgi:hypothetical protein|nr:hypothetical protein [Verrucomicrobiae bacterium]